ncbi:MAG TPA: DJ-1/PfpI family protein [Fibrobacteria bacterium]|nr:DJ-1/PfpI family protein [Fibrobacteria bacterium]
MQHIHVLLFDEFTTLDALGPTEVFSKLESHFGISYHSRTGGPVTSSTGATVDTRPVEAVPENDILLVPGGSGTRGLVDDDAFLDLLRQLVGTAGTVLSVCTGSGLLARAGVLDGREATSNKLAWDWVVSQGPNVRWIRKARWVVDEKFWTSSGITAGIDMALGFVADTIRPEVARKIAVALEHVWNEDGTEDPFC